MSHRGLFKKPTFLSSAKPTGVVTVGGHGVCCCFMNKLLKYSTAQVARLYRFAVFTQPIFALAASRDGNREGGISVEEENHTCTPVLLGMKASFVVSLEPRGRKSEWHHQNSLAVFGFEKVLIDETATIP